MRNKLIICGIILGFSALLNAQTMIGKSKEEVVEKVKKQHREFRKDESIVKQRFNYLKYVNGMRTRTWILYFTDEDICKTSKLVCDYSEYNEELEKLNFAFEKTGESMWEYPVGNDTIQIEIIKQEWYFTIREIRKPGAGE
jgi:hypothetical protein